MAANTILRARAIAHHAVDTRAEATVLRVALVPRVRVTARPAAVIPAAAPEVVEAAVAIMVADLVGAEVAVAPMEAVEAEVTPADMGAKS